MEYDMSVGSPILLRTISIKIGPDSKETKVFLNDGRYYDVYESDDTTFVHFCDEDSNVIETIKKISPYYGCSRNASNLISDDILQHIRKNNFGNYFFIGRPPFYDEPFSDEEKKKSLIVVSSTDGKQLEVYLQDGSFYTIRAFENRFLRITFKSDLRKMSYEVYEGTTEELLSHYAIALIVEIDAKKYGNYRFETIPHFY